MLAQTSARLRSNIMEGEKEEEEDEIISKPGHSIASVKAEEEDKTAISQFFREVEQLQMGGLA